MKKSSANNTPCVTALRFERNRLVVHLADDRELSVPLSHYPTLQKATPAQRRNWKKLGDGFHWPILDLDLSIHSLPEVIPAPPPRRQMQRPRATAAPQRVRRHIRASTKSPT